MKILKKVVIYRSGHDEKVPYMLRWIIFRCRWFSIMVHKFLLSDDDCLHDHPWAFRTFILKGGYWEWRRYDDIPLKELEKLNFEQVERAIGPDGSLQVKRRFDAPCTLYRKANTAHRVEIDKPCWTLVITFKKMRRWGFITKNGWVHHSQYNSNVKCD